MSPESKKKDSKTGLLSSRFKKYLREAGEVEKSFMGIYDGILEEWLEDCLAFIEGRVGKVPPHVVQFLGSDEFKLKFRTGRNSEPDTYAVRMQRGGGLSDIAIDFGKLEGLPREDLVVNFFLGLVEELLHTRYGLTLGEAEIGKLTNELTEEFLGISLGNEYKQKSLRRRRNLDDRRSPRDA